MTQRYPPSLACAEGDYNYFRDYDPSIGRYVESDRVGLRGGLNTYAYVGNRPIVGRDPRGLDNPHMGPYFPPSPSGTGGVAGTAGPGTPLPLGDWTPNGEGGWSNPYGWGENPGGTSFPGVDRGLADPPRPNPNPQPEPLVFPIPGPVLICLRYGSIIAFVAQPTTLGCGDYPEVCGNGMWITAGGPPQPPTGVGSSPGP